MGSKQGSLITKALVSAGETLEVNMPNSETRKAQHINSEANRTREPIALIGIGCRFPAAQTRPKRSGDSSKADETQSLRSRKTAGI